MSVNAGASPGGEGGAQVFFRDLETARQVWSLERGYPGDPWYLDFYKKHEPQGLRLWRVSDKGELATKAGDVLTCGAAVSHRRGRIVPVRRQNPYLSAIHSR